MPSFRLWTFGGLRVEGVGAALPASITQRKRLAFLTLLASSGERGIARDRLLLLLWPESTGDHARGALDQLLYVARRAFGEGSIIGTSELRLDSTIVSSDVADFQSAMARGDLAGMAELYRGPFLDAVYLMGAPELERWIEDKRQEFARSYRNALSRLATQAMHRRDFASTIRYAELLVASDPLSGGATIMLMEALVARGDVAVALDRARDHAAVVRRELGVDVDPGVCALVERLRIGTVHSNVAGGDAAPQPGLPIGEATPSPASDPVPMPNPARRSGRIWRRTAIAAAAVCLIAVGLITKQSSAHTDRTLVILADFKSVGADSTVADALTQAMRRSLSDSRSLGVERESRVKDVMARLQLPTDGRLDTRLARQVAIAEGIRTIVDGSVARFSGGYALSVRLISAQSGDVLTSAEQTVLNADGLIVALDTLSRVLRGRAGDALKEIRAAPPLEKLTSSSFDAMMKYSAGRRALFVEGNFDKSAELTQEALALDTSFAAAIQQLEFALLNAHRSSIAERRLLLKRAHEHRDRLTEEERLHVENSYLYSPNGVVPSRARWVDMLRQIVASYPNAEDLRLLGSTYAARGDMKAAEGFLRRAIALDSTQPAAYLRLVEVLLTAGRLSAARGAVDDLARRFPEWVGVPQSEASVLYAEGHLDEARAAWLVGSRSRDEVAATWADDGLARLDLLEGRVAAWQRDSHASIALDSAAGRFPVVQFPELTANYWVLHQAGESLRELDSPNKSASPETQDLRRAILYAQYDRPDRARALLAAHDSVVKDTLGGWLQGTDRQEALGWIFLAEGRPADAVVAFRGSRMLSDGPPDASPIAADVETGIAFERAGMPDSAITAYEHYMNTPWGGHFRDDAFRLPWALEHVAALYEAKGNTKKAISAYQRLADLWREADPELQPRVAHARQRIAALSGAAR